MDRGNSDYYTYKGIFRTFRVSIQNYIIANEMSMFDIHQPKDGKTIEEKTSSGRWILLCEFPVCQQVGI